jgi:hypothetical protein
VIITMTYIGDIEREVLGSLIMKPELLETCDLEDTDFEPGLPRETFSHISKIWEDHRLNEIDARILADHIGGGNSEIVYVSSLFDGAVRQEPDILKFRISELRKRKLVFRITAKLSERSASGEINVDDIRSDLEQYESLTNKPFDPAKILISGSEMQDLDIQVEWAVEKLIPAQSLTLLHGPGGVGKTWLGLCISKAVSAGVPFLGLQTKTRPVVYVDYENPWRMLVDRVKRLDINEVQFWHLSKQPPPPRLDGPTWDLYKRVVPPGSLIIIDTSRSSHDGEENSSQDAALVMNRLKEIREFGNDILLLHHTTKLNERAPKGSTAWEDLSDHVLAFHKAKSGTLDESDGGGLGPGVRLSLGTGRKTRYEPAHFFLTFNLSEGGFSLAEDPDSVTIDAIAEYIKGPGKGKTQSEIISYAKDAGIGPGMRSNFTALLRRGETTHWISHKVGKLRIYEPI